jgi:hypothetical protein
MNHPPFLDDLGRARDSWNERHPNDRITGSGVPDDEPFIRNSAGEELWVAHPPQLRSAYAAHYSRARSGADGYEPGSHPSLSVAAEDWTALVSELCERWWPPAIFPNWLPAGHPAAPFVSAALIWNTRLLSDDWIVTASPRPLALRHDPQKPDSHVAWRAQDTAWSVLTRSLLRALFDQQESVSLDDFETAVRNADLAALDVWGQEISQGDLYRARYWAVPLYAGMSREDWKKLAEEALRIARSAENRIDKMAVEKLKNGQGVASVANDFGLSRPTVQHWQRALRAGVEPLREQ